MAALIPYAVAQLCQASCSQAAAALAVAHTGLHAAFASTDNGTALLIPYLSSHAAALRREDVQPDLTTPGLGVPAAAAALWQGLPQQVELGLKQFV